jgi:Ca2+-transporting ATPase
VISWRRGALILYHGALIAAVAAIAFHVTYGGDAARLPAARTAAFATIAYAQLTFSFACRSHRYTLPQLGALTNPWLIGAIAASALLQLFVLTVPPIRPLFHTTGVLSWQWLLMIVVLALLPVTFVEVAKLLRARFGR